MISTFPKLYPLCRELQLQSVGTVFSWVEGSPPTPRSSLSSGLPELRSLRSYMLERICLCLYSEDTWVWSSWFNMLLLQHCPVLSQCGFEPCLSPRRSCRSTPSCSPSWTGPSSECLPAGPISVLGMPSSITTLDIFYFRLFRWLCSACHEWVRWLFRHHSYLFFSHNNFNLLIPPHFSVLTFLKAVFHRAVHCSRL